LLYDGSNPSPTTKQGSLATEVRAGSPRGRRERSVLARKGRVLRGRRGADLATGVRARPSATGPGRVTACTGPPSAPCGRQVHPAHRPATLGPWFDFLSSPPPTTELALDPRAEIATVSRPIAALIVYRLGQEILNLQSGVRFPVGAPNAKNRISAMICGFHFSCAQDQVGTCVKRIGRVCTPSKLI
jgi:hypothetical protein